MGLSAGEFFVNLGLKGADGTIGLLNKTTGGFSELKSMSVETKAAILGVLYALEKIVSTSGQLGTSLQNFKAVSDINPDVLQRWEYAAIKAGVPTQTLLNSFLKLQSVAFDVRAGKGLPEWLTPIITSLAQHGQDIGTDWASRWQKDPTLAFKAIQQFAQLSDIDRSTRALALERAGFDPNLVTALMRESFTQANLNKVPQSAILKRDEIERLDTMRQKWDSLWSIVGITGSKMVSNIMATAEQRQAMTLDYYHSHGQLLSRPGGIHHGGTQNKVDIHQQINVHGNQNPGKIKKEAHDGTMEASHKIISTLPSSQTSH